MSRCIRFLYCDTYFVFSPPPPTPPPQCHFRGGWSCVRVSNRFGVMFTSNCSNICVSFCIILQAKMLLRYIQACTHDVTLLLLLYIISTKGWGTTTCIRQLEGVGCNWGVVCLCFLFCFVLFICLFCFCVFVLLLFIVNFCREFSLSLSLCVCVCV